MSGPHKICLFEKKKTWRYTHTHTLSCLQMLDPDCTMFKKIAVSTLIQYLAATLIVCWDYLTQQAHDVTLTSMRRIDVALTSMRLNDVVLTSVRCQFDVMCPLGMHHVLCYISLLCISLFVFMFLAKSVVYTLS